MNSLKHDLTKKGLSDEQPQARLDKEGLKHDLTKKGLSDEQPQARLDKEGIIR